MRRLALSLASLSLFACGGGATPKGPETPVVVTKGGGTVVAPPSGPVRFPEGLVAWGRVARPNAMLKAGAAWAHKGEGELREEIAKAKDVGADLVDLNQPIDGAAILTAANKDGVKGAVAFAVTNVPAARDVLAKHFDVETLGDGTVHGKKKKGSDAKDPDGEPDEDRKIGCLLHPDAHVVCGDEAVLGQLDSFLLRDVPRLNATNDIHVEVRLQPVRDVAGPILNALAAMGDKPKDGDSTDAAAAEAERRSKEEAKAALDDLDTLDYDLSLDDAHAKTEVSVQLRSKKSLFAQSLSDQTAPALSGAYAALEAIGDAALWAGGSRSVLSNQGRAVLAKALEDELKARPAAEKAKIEELAAKVYDAAFTFRGAAFGIDDGILAKLTPAAIGPKATAAAKNRFALAARGDEGMWFAAGFATPFAGAKDTLNSLEKLPPSKKAPKKGETPKEKAKLVPLPKGSPFPAESVHYLTHTEVKAKDAPALDSAAKGKKPAGPVVYGKLEEHVILAPIGGETWLFFGHSLPVLEAAYKAAAAGKPMTPPSPGTVGGLTFAPKFAPAAKFDDFAKDPEVVAALLGERARLAATPSLGITTVRGADPERPKLTVRFDLPRATYEALKAFDDKHIGSKP